MPEVVSTRQSEAPWDAVHVDIVTLINDALARFAPDVSPPDSALSRADQRGLPTAHKLRLLEHVHQEAGASMVLRLGRVLEADQHPSNALFFVLKNSSSVDELLEKSRRYSDTWHTQNHLRLIERGTRRLVLGHARRDGAAPHPLESAFRCGVSIMFLEHVGCRGLTVRWPEDGPLVYEDGAYLEPPLDRPHRWSFEWTSEEPRPTIAGLDAYLLREDPPVALVEALRPHQRLVFMLRREPARPWTVRLAARSLGMSIRSLQRALAAEDTTFSQAILQVRVEVAQCLLIETEHTCAAIGELAGFSDPSHFTRSFRQESGVTPRQYRDQERPR